MKREMKKELQVGLGLFALTLILRRFFAVPELFVGILMGLSISLMTVSAIPENVRQALKQWKKSIGN